MVITREGFHDGKKGGKKGMMLEISNPREKTKMGVVILNVRVVKKLKFIKVLTTKMSMKMAMKIPIRTKIGTKTIIMKRITTIQVMKLSTFIIQEWMVVQQMIVQ